MTQEYSEKDTELLFAETRAEAADSFQQLPDGAYQGQAYIVVNTVNNLASPNYGRKKYEIQLTVTEGKHQGRLAYHHRLILPSFLGNKPPASDALASTAWKERTQEYLRKTNNILRNCGVDTSDTDTNRLTIKIAENNRKQPVVNFTMKNGVAYINYVAHEGKGREETSAAHGNLRAAGVELPDGNDLVLA